VRGAGGRIADSNPNPPFQPQWRCSLPTSKDSVNERLTRYRQIKIRVIGRKFGRRISVPVWFVLDGEKLYLLPVQGSETQWFKNVLQNPQIRIDVRAVEI